MKNNVLMSGREFMEKFRERFPELEIPKNVRALRITADIEDVLRFDIEYFPAVSEVEKCSL